MSTLNEMLSEFEQLETEAVQTARTVAAYYKQLKLDGLPEGLVMGLTFDFARAWWGNSLGLNVNEQHIYMHNGMEGDEE